MFALWIECFKMGLRELWRHRLRSFLTMIGMIMGVSVVIICVSVVQGVKDSLISDIRKAGRNMIFVITEDTRKSTGALQPGGVAVSNLSRADADAIESECESVTMASGTQGLSLQVGDDDGVKAIGLAGSAEIFDGFASVILAVGVGHSGL